MDRTHETMLLDTLRDVFDFGTARLPYRLLNRWFEAERLSKRVWVGLDAHWQTVLDERNDKTGWRLGYIRNERSDEITLICLEPKRGAQSRFQPIETLAKKGDAQ